MMDKIAQIYFRTDATPTIGYGHFIRSLALADMLKDKFDCIFATVSPTAYQIMEMEKVCNWIALPPDEQDKDTFLSMLKGNEMVVLDNYFFSTTYQQAIKSKGCKLVCVDDMHNKHYVADVVINPVITDTSLFSTEPYTKYCLGYEWALLRKPFLNANKEKQKNQFPYRRIVLNFGGSDKFNLTGSVLSILKDLPTIETITCVVGDGYCEELEYHPKVSVRKNLSAEQIVNLFLETDLAILSTGTVCLEAKACGTTIAAGYYVDNQKEAYESFVQQKEILPLDNLLENGLENKIKQALETKPTSTMMNFSGIQEKYISLFKRLSDIKNYVIDDLVFLDYRNLSTSQHRIIWEARNDERIRCWMEHPEPFSFENHLKFVAKLQESNNHYWAIYKDGQFIASVNISKISSNEANYGIFIAPDLLGCGLATKTEEAAEKLYKQMGIKTIRAYIMKDNIRSIKYNLKRGFTIYQENNTYIHIRKDLK